MPNYKVNRPEQPAYDADYNTTSKEIKRVSDAVGTIRSDLDALKTDARSLKKLLESSSAGKQTTRTTMSVVGGTSGSSSGGGGGTVVPDATTSAKGILQLARDLGGTAVLPVVVGLQGSDVAATAPANGETLIWSTSNSRWEPGAISAGYSPSGITNQTLRFNGTNTLAASSLLANTGTRIGINTTTPSAAVFEIYDNGSSTNGTAFIFSNTAKGASSGGGIGLCANWLMRAQGQRLGYIYLQGKNNDSGGSIINAVSMEAFANEDWVAGTYGSYATISVMPNGTSARAEMLRINGTGLGVKSTVPNSVLTVGGSVSHATRIVSSGSRTLDATDHFLFASSGVTITLPTAVGITGRVYVVKMVGSGTVTISTTSSQTIDGTVGTTITTPHGVLRIISDGANWQSW